MDWGEVRALFPAVSKWTYLNTATYGQVSLRSRAAVQEHLDRRDRLACQDFLSWFDDLEEIRGMIGQLIHASSDDIAFAGNACTGLALFLSGIDWQPGDKIATVRNEFPNQYAAAGHLHPAGVELVEITDFSRPLPAKTRAVIASTVSYTVGVRPDLCRLRELADAAGALYYLDGTQSIGALQFDVREVRPDMLSVDAYKWLMSPNGAGFFYVSPELRSKLEPRVVGWRSDKDWRNVNALHNGTPRFSERAEKYEGGMVDFPSIYAMGEALRLVLELGPEAVERRVLALAGYLSDGLKSAGADIYFEGSNIVSAGWAGRDVEPMMERLKGERVLVSMRERRLRISAHIYNNEADVEALLRLLQ